MTATSTSSIESNNVHVKQIENIWVNPVAWVPLHAICQRHHQKKMYSPFNHAYRGDISGCNAEKRLTTVASNLQGLHQRLMFLLNNHHTGSLAYRACCRSLYQGKKPFNAWFRIMNDKRQFKRAGMHPAVDVKWLSWLVLMLRSTQSFVGGLCYLRLLGLLQQEISTACSLHWKDVTGFANVLYWIWLASFRRPEWWSWLT